jgi:2-keto-4-pentenoate hydratase/2-oxohepta-3-ene-1,7-dioic acid hydratase in catechol pathway
MRICRFATEAGAAPRLGLVEAGEIVDVTAALAALPPLTWPAPHGDHLIRHLDLVVAAIPAAAAAGPRHAADQVALLSPVANPSKVIAAPLNYDDHVAESGQDAAIHHHTHQTTFEGYATPIDKLGLFLKASSSVVGPSAGVAVCPNRRNDHEVELCVVIGREAKDVSVDDALGVVAGYCVGLDMTVRGPEERSFRKSLDGYTVLGPWLVSADEIADPSSLDLELTVNRQPRQRANTRHLTVGIRSLVSLASRWYRLYPGDVIMTGTPAGVGPVEAGDRIVATIEAIGTITVAVR